MNRVLPEPLPIAGLQRRKRGPLGRKDAVGARNSFRSNVDLPVGSRICDSRVLSHPMVPVCRARGRCEIAGSAPTLLRHECRVPAASLAPFRLRMARPCASLAPVVVFLLAFTLVSNLSATGKLVVIGGGAIPDSVRKTFIELGGGTNAHLLLIPQASAREHEGETLRKLFAGFGMQRMTVLDLSDPKNARKQIRDAEAVWIGGGQQKDLMNKLEQAGVVVDLRARFRSGITFGGTSAGAAVMSDLMIAGDALPIDHGLALWPEVIVDQHFVARKRFNRSLRTIQEHPEKIGVGIDEGTAVVVSDGEFKVIGVSSVTVIDARNATCESRESGLEGSWRNIRLHWLRAGQVFRYREKRNAPAR